jgi:hypothetical protein
MNWFPWQPKPWLLWMSCSCFIYYYKEFCVLTLSLQSLICVWEVGQEPNWRSSLRCLNTYRFKFLDFMCMEDEWGIIISQLSIPYLSLRLWEWESLHRLIHCRISYPSVFCWIISAFYITSVILISMFAMVSTFYNTFAFFYLCVWWTTNSTKVFLGFLYLHLINHDFTNDLLVAYQRF